MLRIFLKNYKLASPSFPLLYFSVFSTAISFNPYPFVRAPFVIKCKQAAWLSWWHFFEFFFCRTSSIQIRRHVSMGKWIAQICVQIFSNCKEKGEEDKKPAANSRFFLTLLTSLVVSVDFGSEGTSMTSVNYIPPENRT